ncbi:MAG: AraC family transcriptional regulator [Acidobacteriota bacterium]
MPTRQANPPCQATPPYGERLKPLRWRGLEVSECAFQAGCRLPEHPHKRASFSLVLEGGYRERYGRRDLAIEPMQVVFMPAAHSHCIEIGPQDSRGLRIELEPDWIAGRQTGAAPEHLVERQGGDLLWLGLRLLAEFRQPDDCSTLAIEGLTLEMLAHATRHQRRGESCPPDWLRRVTERIRDEHDRPLTVQGLAADVGRHPIHLSRVFRQHHRVSIGHYLRRTRVRFACRRLGEPEIQLADLALSAGFADQSQFTRAFRKVMGTTPGRYRKRVLDHP